MPRRPLGAMLRMVAELVAAMVGYMGSDFDAGQTAVDFVRAMQLDRAFREEVEDAHGRVTAAAAASKPPMAPLTLLKPVFRRLVERCANILEPRGRA